MSRPKETEKESSYQSMIRSKSSFILTDSISIIIVKTENLRAPQHREELNVSYEEALHKQRNQYDEDFVFFSSYEFPERLFHIAII